MKSARKLKVITRCLGWLQLQTHEEIPIVREYTNGEYWRPIFSSTIWQTKQIEPTYIHTIWRKAQVGKHDGGQYTDWVPMTFIKLGDGLVPVGTRRYVSNGKYIPYTYVPWNQLLRISCQLKEIERWTNQQQKTSEKP